MKRYTTRFGIRGWFRLPIKRVGGSLACGVIAFCMATLWGIVVPLGEAPDEPGHYAYVTSVMGGHLPPLTMPTTPEAFQPPAAYLIDAATVRSVSPPYAAMLEPNPTVSFNPSAPRTPTYKAMFLHPSTHGTLETGWVRLWHLLRLTSAGWLALAAMMAYRTARRLFPDSPALWPLVAAGVTLLPQQVFIGMTVSNDPAALGMAALGLWALVVAWQGALPPRVAWLYGVLAGLLALTKLSLAPLALALIVGPAIWRRAWPWGMRSALPAVLLWLPWGIRLWLFDGDPTGQRANLSLHPTLRPPDNLTSQFWREVFMTTEASTWGRFGWMNIALPLDIYRPATVIVGVLLIAGLVVGLRRADRILWMTLIGIVLITMLALIRYIATVGYSAAQGRLLVTCIPVVVTLCALPWATPLRRVPALMGWVGLVAIAMLDVLILFAVIRPAYA